MSPRRAVVAALLTVALAAPAGRAAGPATGAAPADPAPGFDAPPPSSRFT